MNELEEKLQAPFPADEIEWRIGRSGKKGDNVWATALAYVSNRAIQNRLDDVFGCMSWANQFKEWHGDSQICGISVHNSEQDLSITKWDGADGTQFESTKGGLSDSMKRAAVQWGIGRYLYNLEETFIKDISTTKKTGYNYAKTKDNVPFYWKAPDLPKWALPSIENSIKKELGGKELKAGETLNNQVDKNLEYYEKIFSECKTAKELNAKYEGLPSDEKKKKGGKPTLAYTAVTKRHEELT